MQVTLKGDGKVEKTINEELVSGKRISQKLFEKFTRKLEGPIFSVNGKQVKSEKRVSDSSPVGSVVSRVDGHTVATVKNAPEYATIRSKAIMCGSNVVCMKRYLEF